jgi:hypothetical protein
MVAATRSYPVGEAAGIDLRTPWLRRYAKILDARRDADTGLGEVEGETATELDPFAQIEPHDAPLSFIACRVIRPQCLSSGVGGSSVQ